MDPGDIQHRTDDLYTLIQTADKLGVCSLQGKFGGGNDLRPELVLETVNKNAVPRGLCPMIRGIGVQQGVEGNQEE